MGLAPGGGQILDSRRRACSLDSFALKQIDNEKAATLAPLNSTTQRTAIVPSPPGRLACPPARRRHALCMATARRYDVLALGTFASLRVELVNTFIWQRGYENNLINDGLH